MARPHASASITIQAPIEVVWRVMLDTAGYPAWNPFVIAVERAAGEPVVGQRMRLTVRWSDGRRVRSPEVFERIDPPSPSAPGALRRAALVYGFRGPLHALFLVRASRHQTLEETGPATTIYRTEETFGGLLAAAVPLARVQDGFERNAQALKARAEALAAG